MTVQSPWPPPPQPNALPECPYCGAPTLRAVFMRNGCCCTPCLRIDGDSPDAPARLWLREWQATVRRIHTDRAQAEVERQQRIAERHRPA